MDMPVITAPEAAAADRIAPISRQIWDGKYRLKAQDGTPIDQTIEDTWRRVARTLASVEAESARWEPRFYRALEDFRFLPAGRILSGAGSGRRVTLFNCFVMGRIEDDLGSIFAHLREAALPLGRNVERSYPMPPPCCMVSAASRRCAKMPPMSSGMAPITKQLNSVTSRSAPAPAMTRPAGKKRKSSIAV